MERFNGKYRIPSARAQWWDYAHTGAYFITICTAHRQHYFGKISTPPVVQLSELGQLAHRFWYEIPDHFTHIELGAFVVMPNHIHGILIIGDNPNPAPPAPDHSAGGVTHHKNPMLHENISRVIRWYKGRCTFEMRKIDSNFAWQSRFHDHIIRNDGEYLRISHYIETNPDKWINDIFHTATGNI